MARSHRTKIKRRSRNKSAPHRGRASLRYSLFAVLVITGLASVISINLAALTLGFFGLCIFSLIEYRIRQKWEMAYSFKIKHIEERTNGLSEMVSQHDYDISMLKRRSASRPMAKPKTETKVAPKPAAAPSLQKKRGIRYADLAERKPASLGQKALSGRATPLSSKLVQPKKSAPLSKAISNKNGSETPSFSAAIIEDRLNYAVTRAEIEVFSQPIMRLPAQQVRFQELFTRLKVRPGLYIPAEQYADTAKKKNLQKELDMMLLVRCLHMLNTARAADDVMPFFFNLEPAMLKNMDFMKALLGFAAKNRLMMSKIIFELPQDYFLTMPTALLKVMKGLGDLGCGFSLDHVRRMNEKHFDVQRLMDYKIRMIKVSAKMLLDSETPQTARDFMRIKNKLEGNGIGVIAEKVENSAQLRELEALNIHYAQGFALGAPRIQRSQPHIDLQSSKKSA